jgi:molybdopterin molybdotransferase
MGETPMQVIDFERALETVMEHARLRRQRCADLKAEEVPLLDSLGRVLAKGLLADRDQPPFDRATRDGFAVRADALSAGPPLKIIGQVRAGEVWQGAPMKSGEAIEIMTGAPVPAGADAVVMIEHVNLSEGTVQAARGRTLRVGENIVPRGSEAHEDTVVVPATALIGAAEIALAANSGMSTLEVFSRPTVAIVATGDELVDLSETPDARQIRNSNSYALVAMVATAGGKPERLEIARDVREQLRERVAQGRQHDLVLFSGGVSMGKFDLVEEVLSEFGAEFIFTGVKMQPGKPVVFGRLPKRDDGDGTGPECYFFGLPGNPVSTQVTFHCFVEPFLRLICGEEVTGPHFVQATLSEDVEAKASLTRVLPAHLSSDFRQPSVRLVSWQGSGDLAANARANCYAVLPSEHDDFHAGDVITVLLR